MLQLVQLDIGSRMMRAGITQALYLVPEFNGLYEWNVHTGRGLLLFEHEDLEAWILPALEVFQNCMALSGWNPPRETLEEMLGVPRHLRAETWKRAAGG